MTDTELVERLRNGRWIGGELIALEAADRIEALNEYIASMREAIPENARDIEEAAEAENTKLRKLLQRIINDLQQRADILKDGPRAERVVPLSDGVYMEALAALSKEGDG